MRFKNMEKAGFDLQIFAEGEGESRETGEGAGDGGGQDEPQEKGADEGAEGEVKFTQADVDRIVGQTIARERARAERAAKNHEKQEDDKDPESEETRARKAAEERASKAEVKVACYEAGVGKDAVDDVAALAHAYMESDKSLLLEEAIEKVVKKYPQFKAVVSKPQEDVRRGAWGERQGGRTDNVSGVEAAFLKRNPGLKV